MLNVPFKMAPKLSHMVKHKFWNFRKKNISIPKYWNVYEQVVLIYTFVLNI